eukprot:6189413-Pleurochrysis_carterae.AAC.1
MHSNMPKSSKKVWRHHRFAAQTGKLPVRPRLARLAISSLSRPKFRRATPSKHRRVAGIAE